MNQAQEQSIRDRLFELRQKIQQNRDLIDRKVLQVADLRQEIVDARAIIEEIKENIETN